MIKAIIFDFDGVILESADIKTEAFKELFSEHASKIKEIVDYHLLNGGISRYVKFRYIYEHILGMGLSKQEEEKLGERFSQIALEKMIRTPFVRGAQEFLERNKKRYQFFICSGTPETELLDIIRARKLGGYFKEVRGSPAVKIDIINAILRDHHLLKQEIIYVGDAQSDRIAAEKAGVVYIERIKDLIPKPGNSLWAIRDLSGLDDLLEKIENANLTEGN